jgi:GTPase
MASKKTKARAPHGARGRPSKPPSPSARPRPAKAASPKAPPKARPKAPPAEPPQPARDRAGTRAGTGAALDKTGGETRCGTVALVGRPNVGKSTLLNAILGQKIAPTTHKPQTTRRALRGVETRGDSQIIFVDTPGLHQARGGLHKFMIDEALDAARGVDVIAFVVEASTRAGAEKTSEGSARHPAIHPEDQRALAQLARSGALKVPLILVINKVDVVADKKLLLPLLDAWSRTGADGQSRFEALIPISAKTGNGVGPLLDDLAARMPPGPFVFDSEAMTDARERDIAAELIREKVMLELQQELPYRAAVVVEEMDESRREDLKKPLVHVAAVIHVEKDSQKAMVIGKRGQRIKAIGERSRKELEKLLGCQVMLELLVRVEPDWTSDPRGLAKLGYVRHR